MLSRLTKLAPFRAAPLRGLATKKAKPDKPFDKILIANRGEIAVRIIRTARRMGVKTVAVYSDADARAMHVSEADEAYCIGTAQSADSYLLMDRLMDVVKKTGAQAIHPGYGFLSENAKFVDMVEAAGIAFIGPSSGPMDDMGDKINSKIIAKNAGCFVIPGFEGEIESEDVAAIKANEVGYPVMIKASAGGGGKGMRVAYNDDEVREGFRLSKAEALASFGDDRMLIERFIEDPHHIEIQVLADSFGNVAAFPERECSVQRRNQKVIEESPSCLLTPETRRKMQEQAIMLCKATGYRSAGTVEMLADGKQNFYFLEMNTRLQVEHPVTEMVGGEDLVEHMLWVAGGQPLPDRMIKQPFIPANGHAFESRVYAEDPIRKFLPSIGPLINYKEPEANFACGASFDEAAAAAAAAHDGCVTRVDSGVYEGGEISMYYDPMISKLITHGPDRPTALRAMARSLDEYIISGLGNNLSFLRSVCRNEKFAVGDYGTGFIAEEYPEGFSGVVLHEPELRRMAAMGATLHWAKAGGQEQEDAQSAFVVTMPKGGESKEERCFAVSVSMSGALDHAEDEDLDADLDTFNEGGVMVRMWDLDHISQLPSEGDAAAHYASHEIVIRDLDWRSGAPDMRVVLEDGSDAPKGEAAKVEAQQGEEESVTYEGRTSAGIMLRYRGARREIVVRSPREHELSGHMLEPEEKDLSAFLVSPMPGTLVSCDVQAGDFVEEGQTLAVVEAMKMQNSLRAEMSGQVAAVRVSAGDQLKVDQIIIEFVVPEAASDEAKEVA